MRQTPGFSGQVVSQAVSNAIFRSKYSWLFLTLPALLLVLALFVTPLLYLGWVSFWEYNPRSFRPTDLTGENYARFWLDGFYLQSMVRSFKLAALTTCVSLVIGYPYALIMSKASSRIRGFLLLLLLLPLMTSAVVRVFGWMVLLGNNGLVNRLLLAVGVTGEPLQLMHSMTAVVIGLVNVELAFMVLPIYTAVLGLDRALPEAAGTLGANPLKSFLRVTFPLSLPGAMAGCAIVFALTVSSFLQPQLLGGSRFFVMTTVMYQQVTTTLNWPFAAAIGLSLLVSAVAAITILTGAVRLLGTKINRA